MSKREIMESVNNILNSLEFYSEEFIDRVTEAIAANEPFDEEEIEELA